MKVALIFRGLLRCFEHSYPFWKAEIMDKYDTDVYFDIHSEVGFYSGKGYQQSPSDEFVKIADNDRGFHDSGELVDANKITSLYHPKILRIDDAKMYDDEYRTLATFYPKAYTRPKNTLMQFRKVRDSYQLMEGTGKSYDMVINTRPDIVLENPFPLLNPNIVYTLPSRNKLNRGTGDSLFISNMENVHIFRDIHDNIPNIYQEVGVSCPHEYVAYSIKKFNPFWSELGIGAHIMHSPKGPYQEPE